MGYEANAYGIIGIVLDPTDYETEKKNRGV